MELSNAQAFSGTELRASALATKHPGVELTKKAPQHNRIPIIWAAGGENKQKQHMHHPNTQKTTTTTKITNGGGNRQQAEGGMQGGEREKHRVHGPCC
jgi:hypothetical protein